MPDGNTVNKWGHEIAIMERANGCNHKFLSVQDASWTGISSTFACSKRIAKLWDRFEILYMTRRHHCRYLCRREVRFKKWNVRSGPTRFTRDLTHWGRVTHICVGKLTIIGSDNGLSPGRRHAIIWTIAGIMIIGPLGINFSEILIRIQTFSFCRLRNGVHLSRPQCHSRGAYSSA